MSMCKTKNRKIRYLFFNFRNEKYRPYFFNVFPTCAYKLESLKSHRTKIQGKKLKLMYIKLIKNTFLDTSASVNVLKKSFLMTIFSSTRSRPADVLIKSQSTLKCYVSRSRKHPSIGL